MDLPNNTRDCYPHSNVSSASHTKRPKPSGRTEDKDNMHEPHVNRRRAASTAAAPAIQERETMKKRIKYLRRITVFFNLFM